jgi:serine/threonine protein kinase
MPAIKAFYAEAAPLSTLSHRALCRVFEVFDERGHMYLVMEYIHGSDLESLVNKTRTLPVEKIIEWAIVVCDALDYLHIQAPPFIFRDLKPSNIMIDSFGKVRLIDFAISQRIASALGQPTSIGTEGYAAPECVRGELSPLTDVYSLGATLHHIITRLDPRIIHPFNVYERPMRDFNPDVSDELEHIVMKALAFDSNERWQSAGEMKAALESLS